MGIEYATIKNWAAQQKEAARHAQRLIQMMDLDMKKEKHEYYNGYFQAMADLESELEKWKSLEAESAAAMQGGKKQWQ